MSVAHCSLLELLSSVDASVQVPDVQITGLTSDSRCVTDGDVFVALDGFNNKGLDFAVSAEKKGAVAVIVDAASESLPDIDIPLIKVPRLQQGLGKLAATFYNSPAMHVRVIGVTGTNGKTSVCHYISEALKDQKGGCGFVGTTGTGSAAKALKPSANTTPDVISVHALLADFRQQHIDTVAMEVSSHALDQGRVDEVAFSVAVFTNLSRDHLDYHGNINAYAAAKQQLLLGHDVESVVINIDDPEGLIWKGLVPEGMRVITVSANGTPAAGLHLYAENVILGHRGITFDLVSTDNTQQLVLPLLGRFNVDNSLLAVGALMQLGHSLSESCGMLESVTPAAGRMEALGGGNKPLVVVDYSHTPDALEKALESMRQHCNGQLICVFGCGGDRDTGKRSMMGVIAERLADEVIVTDDNPRTEVPQSIAVDILSAMQSPDRVRVIHDRLEAIRCAFQSASPADCILVAGKGHEDYQITASGKRSFSDRKAVESLLEGYQR